MLTLAPIRIRVLVPQAEPEPQPERSYVIGGIVGVFLFLIPAWIVIIGGLHWLVRAIWG